MVANEHTGSWKLNIERVDCCGDAATQVIIHSPSYPTLAGTAVTGVNLNRDSTDTAIATAKADETGNTQANVIGGGAIPVTQTISFWLPEIRLGYQKCIAVDYVTTGTAAIVTIWGYFSTS